MTTALDTKLVGWPDHATRRYCMHRVDYLLQLAFEIEEEHEDMTIEQRLTLFAATLRAGYVEWRSHQRDAVLREVPSTPDFDHIARVMFVEDLVIAR